MTRVCTVQYMLVRVDDREVGDVELVLSSILSSVHSVIEYFIR